MIPPKSLTIVGDGQVHPLAGTGPRAKWVQVEVPSSNVSNALIGGTEVTSSVGFPLPPGWFGQMLPPVAELTEFYTLNQLYYWLAVGDVMYILYGG